MLPLKITEYAFFSNVQGTYIKKTMCYSTMPQQLNEFVQNMFSDHNRLNYKPIALRYPENP